ncbi:unnamed protein product, partial [Anisakis simplex]|uniref:Serine/arginine repetitive matrix protein 2 n=1 Tax=Anisakis simplex TaxID=6269 RepID=A0A0M3KBK9_ANISI
RPKSRKKDSIQHEDENKLVNISQEHVEPSSPSAPGDNVRKTSDESSTSKDDGQIRLQRFGGKFAGEVTSEDSLDTKDPETSRIEGNTKVVGSNLLLEESKYPIEKETELPKEGFHLHETPRDHEEQASGCQVDAKLGLGISEASSRVQELPELDALIESVSKFLGDVPEPQEINAPGHEIASTTDTSETECSQMSRNSKHDRDQKLEQLIARIGQLSDHKVFCETCHRMRGKETAGHPPVCPRERSSRSRRRIGSATSHGSSSIRSSDGTGSSVPGRRYHHGFVPSVSASSHPSVKEITGRDRWKI